MNTEDISLLIRKSLLCLSSVSGLTTIYLYDTLFHANRLLAQLLGFHGI